MGGKYGFMTRVSKSRRPAGFQLNTDPYLSLSLVTLEQYYIAELSLLLADSGCSANHFARHRRPHPCDVAL
jgi:hypothetical protein